MLLNIYSFYAKFQQNALPNMCCDGITYFLECWRFIKAIDNIESKKCMLNIDRNSKYQQYEKSNNTCIHRLKKKKNTEKRKEKKRNAKNVGQKIRFKMWKREIVNTNHSKRKHLQNLFLHLKHTWPSIESAWIDVNQYFDTIFVFASKQIDFFSMNVWHEYLSSGLNPRQGNDFRVK